MRVCNMAYHRRGGKSERVGIVLESILDAEVPGWRNKV